jgi:hypothetical protein
MIKYTFGAVLQRLSWFKMRHLKGVFYFLVNGFKKEKYIIPASHKTWSVFYSPREYICLENGNLSTRHPKTQQTFNYFRVQNHALKRLAQEKA